MKEFKPQYPLVKTSCSGMMNNKTGRILSVDEIEKIAPEQII